MTAVNIAIEALAEIAGRGIVRENVVWTADNESSVWENQCPECYGVQHFAGPCGNRDCLTFIARSACDEIRRVA